MKKIEKIGKMMEKYLLHKHILEVACGCAEFSIMASTIALKVECIDLDDGRLLPQIKYIKNVEFQKMDATKLHYSCDAFDTVILYNSIGHLFDMVNLVIYEGMRVLKTNGTMLIISNWKMDKSIINVDLIPFLESVEIPYSLLSRCNTTYVIIRKQ